MCFARTFEALATLDEMIRKDLDLPTYASGCHVISEIARKAAEAVLGWSEKDIHLKLVGLLRSGTEDEWIPHYGCHTRTF
jgi:hypothetical protein